MSKLFTLLKSHRKKTLFACGLSAYLYNYLSNIYIYDLSRRNVCSLVKPQGDNTVASTAPLRRLTVFLNPFARRGRLLKEFDKNVAPILQLAGLDVQMVYTDSDVEIKDFSAALDVSTTDGILVASDDHVVQKVVSAMLQRDDYTSSRIQALPIGVVPVGVWNTFVQTISKHQNIVEWCYGALQPVLASTTRPQNVLEVTMLAPATLDQEKSQSEINGISGAESSEQSYSQSGIDKPSSDSTSSKAKSPRRTHSLLGLEWSVWRDVEHGGGTASSKPGARPKNTNDHLGLLGALDPFSPKTWTRHIGVLYRHFWFWILSSTHQPIGPALSPFFEQTAESAITRKKNRCRTKCARLVYTAPCDGCSKCWETRIKCAETSGNNVNNKQRPRSLLSQLLGLSASPRVPVPKPQTSETVVEDRSNVSNEECGQKHVVNLVDVSGVVLALDGNHIRVDVHNCPPNLLAYIRSTLSRLRQNAYQETVSPTDGSSFSFRCSNVWLYPSNCENEYFWIDNDHFEAYPIEVHVRRNAISVFG